MSYINQNNNLHAAYWQNSLNQEEVSRVPAGHVEAEAVCFNKSARNYIQSELYVTKDDEWTVTCQAVGSNGNLCVLGSGHSKTDSNMALWLNATTSEVEFIFGDGGNSNYKVLVQNVDVTQWHTYRMDLSTGKAWIDDVYQGQSTNLSTVPNERKLTLFNCWRETSNNVVASTFRGKVKEYIIKRNGSMIAHFVPCVQYTGTGFGDTTIGVAGVYDLCNERFCKLDDGFALFSYKINWTVAVDAGYEYSFFTSLFGDSMTVNWGDGSTETLSTATLASKMNDASIAFTHTYASAGSYSLSLNAPLATEKLSLGTINETSTNANKITSVTKLKSRLVPSQFCRNVKNAVLDEKILNGKFHIGDYAFYGCYTNFGGIPECVTSFGSYAFALDTTLDFTSLPSGTVYVGEAGFSGCSNLALASFPYGLKRINNSVFRNCSKITATSLKDVKSIGDYAFRSCSKLAVASFPPGLIYIGMGAFYNCPRITVASIPNGVTNIGSQAFRQCPLITVSSIPNGVTRIESQVFYGCTSITSMSLHNSIVFIGELAFSGCTGMHLSSLPSSLLSIGQSAFENCSQITVSQIPSQCTSIANDAFKRCAGLTTITFGSSTPIVGATVFDNCANLLEIHCPWYEGDVANAPWGATNATVYYLEPESSSSSEGESSSSSSSPYVASMLPPEYIDADGFYVEYQSSAKPYLDTGLNQSNADIWEVTYAAPSNYTNNVPLIGSGNSKTSGNYAIWVNNSTGEVQFIYGNGSDNSYIIRTTVGNTKTLHNYKMNLVTGEAWIDGFSLGTVSTIGTISTPKKIVLFGCWRGSSNFNASHGIIAECKITRSNVLTRHFVPFHRWTDGKDGLYDVCQGNAHFMSNNTGEATFAFNVQANLSVLASYEHSIPIHQFISETTTVNWGDGSATASNVYGESTLQHVYSNADTVCAQLNGGFMRWFSMTNQGSNGDKVQELMTFSGKKTPHDLCRGAGNMTASEGVLGSVYAIDNNSFRGCSSLAWTTLPDVIKYIGDSAFQDCSSLALTELPSDLKYIGTSAFSGCTALSFSTFPTGVETVGEYAFYQCNGLTTITFLGTPTSLDVNTFTGCQNLTTINVPWSSGDVAGAPWGATNATINYNS